MNNDEMWMLQLWSGAFGATIGAILAAGVALLVVWLTNRKQGRLAEQSMAHQAQLAAAALNEQKFQAETALVAQKAALAQQLAEQREEARKGRMIAAVTDTIEAVHQLAYGKPFDHGARMSHYGRAYAAATRWHIEEAADFELGERLAWPQWLYRLAKATEADGGSEASRNAQADAASHFQIWASKWPNAEGNERREVRAQLRLALLSVASEDTKKALVRSATPRVS